MRFSNLRKFIIALEGSIRLQHSLNHAAAGRLNSQQGEGMSRCSFFNHLATSCASIVTCHSIPKNAISPKAMTLFVSGLDLRTNLGFVTISSFVSPALIHPKGDVYQLGNGELALPKGVSSDLEKLFTNS